MRFISPLPLALIVVSLLVAPVPATAQESEPDWGFTELDAVELGEPLTGDRISHYDLRRRIVVLYQWGITCPISTGAFPYMDRLLAKYEDRGVAVIGFQVRRNPDVLRENVSWYLQHLRPTFPVCRLGNDWEWPARILPWVIVFDHRGKRIHAGNVPGIEKVLDAALEKAPDWMFGGPYTKLADVVAKLRKDRHHFGPHLAEIRKLAAATEGDAEAIAEAKALIAAVTEYFDWQMAKADEEAHGPVEEADVYVRLGKRFGGDPVLFPRVGKKLMALTEKSGASAEIQGHDCLKQALRMFRRLPPAGNYAYNMDYTLTKDASVLAARSRILAEFRLELERIKATWAGTTAAEDAGMLLFEHSMPFLEKDAAKTRLDLAEKLVAEGKTPYELFEARLLLYEIGEGYFGEDEISKRTADLLAGMKKETLVQAGAKHRMLSETEANIREEVRREGSALPRKEADRLIRKMESLAEQSGASSRLSRRSAAWVARLEKSYDGPAHLGVAFLRRYAGTGMQISWVYPRTGAEAGGLKIGDIIIEFDEVPIAGSAEMTKVLGEAKVGQSVKIVILRGKEKMTIEVTMGRRI
jgi:hypothetical protein